MGGICFVKKIVVIPSLIVVLWFTFFFHVRKVGGAFFLA
jgi:hypothetical protein